MTTTTIEFETVRTDSSCVQYDWTEDSDYGGDEPGFYWHIEFPTRATGR